ncbi:MAG: CDGSH iron-sulfur domain-containing protein [Candidatus Bathyarchaeia archaeon]
MPKNSSAKKDCKITVSKDGPYLVSGGIPLFTTTITCDAQGIPAKWVIGKNLKTAENYALCRCGQSNNKPFCDSTHLKVNFDGTETSTNELFDNVAKIIDGPELKLKDAEILCASARFCHRGGDIWDVIHKSDDPKAKKNVIENACDCPSGRLVVLDKETGMTIEPVLAKSIGIIEDPSIGVGGPFWVRGGIPIYSADGKLYEVRNRVTLCRCGKSSNKPFCDSSHYPEEDREPEREREVKEK